MQRETPLVPEAGRHTPPQAPETERPFVTILPTNRVEALADGIVAIATTLLILEIKQPLVQTGLTAALLHQWPSCATYAVSFLTIAIIWVNHHDLMNMVARVDRAFLFLNTFALMGICAIPFPTGLLGHYLQAGHDQRTAAVAYALVMVFAVSAFPFMWLHLAANPHLLHDATQRALVDGRFFRRSLLGPGIYAGSIPLALVSPQAAVGVYAVVAVYYVLPPVPGARSLVRIKRPAQDSQSRTHKARRPDVPPATEEGRHVRDNTRSPH